MEWFHFHWYILVEWIRVLRVPKVNFGGSIRGNWNDFFTDACFMSFLQTLNVSSPGTCTVSGLWSCRCAFLDICNHTISIGHDFILLVGCWFFHFCLVKEVSLTKVWSRMILRCLILLINRKSSCYVLEHLHVAYIIFSVSNILILVLHLQMLQIEIVVTRWHMLNWVCKSIPCIFSKRILVHGVVNWLVHWNNVERVCPIEAVQNVICVLCTSTTRVKSFLLALHRVILL